MFFTLDKGPWLGPFLEFGPCAWFLPCTCPSFPNKPSWGPYQVLVKAGKNCWFQFQLIKIGPETEFPVLFTYGTTIGLELIFLKKNIGKKDWPIGG